MREKRITFRLTLKDEIALNAIREHLRRTDPWTDRTAVVRFALRHTFEVLNAQQNETR